MKGVFFILIMLLFSIDHFGQNKSLFDVSPKQMSKISNSKSLSDYNYQLLENSISSISLISGGYFIIGTTGGLSSGNLDDNCSVTFGHPYALTSYPVFSIDGTWYKFDDYF